MKTLPTATSCKCGADGIIEQIKGHLLWFAHCTNPKCNNQTEGYVDTVGANTEWEKLNKK